MTAAPPPGFDIFCRVVDNFGDIGVCWRLARQLAATDAQPEVRLWVDKLHALASIEPWVRADRQHQRVKGVELVRWDENMSWLEPHAIVIEAFGCDLPADVIDRILRKNALVINLEYLSAEAWIERCHGLPSTQANGLRKAFFFPGFTDATGGLLREAQLLKTRDQWLAHPALRFKQLEQIGLPDGASQALLQGARQVFLFGYDQAPVSALLSALEQQERPSVVIVAAGTYPGIEETGLPQTVTLHRAPWTDQPGFDRLLWGSDLNFVRGEDSLLRALWAGKPMVWQPYKQEDGAHLVKLDAWLNRSPLDANVRQLMRSWNTGDAPSVEKQLNQALRIDAWSNWRSNAALWARQLATNADLVSSLLTFCTKQRRRG